MLIPGCGMKAIGGAQGNWALSVFGLDQATCRLAMKRAKIMTAFMVNTFAPQPQAAAATLPQGGQ